MIPNPHEYRLTVASAVLSALLMTAGCSGTSNWFKKSEPLPPPINRSQAYVDAKTTLLQCAQDREKYVRSNAIEALCNTLGDEAGEVYLQGLTDPEPVVRFAAAMAIGDLKYAPALRTLKRMASDNIDDRAHAEPDKRVFCAVIYALHELGDDKWTGELAALLFDPEPQVRMDAAMAMGRMGVQSAMGPLKSVLTNERESRVRIQLTESLAMLGDTRSAQVLEAYTKGYFLDDRLMAIRALAGTGSERALRVLREMTAQREPARVRVKAAGELAKLGMPQPGMYEYCLRALREPQTVLAESGAGSRRAADKDSDNLRYLAVLALGWYGNDQVIHDLQPLLSDASGALRVAAAESILRLLKNYRPMTGMTPDPVTPPTPTFDPVAPPAPMPEPTLTPTFDPVAPPAPMPEPTPTPTFDPVAPPAATRAPEAPTVVPSTPEMPATRPNLKTAGGKD